MILGGRQMSTLRLAPTLALLVLAGCASTQMTSIRDPSAPARTYGRILVIAPFSDLQSRMQASRDSEHSSPSFHTVISPD